MDAPLSQFTVPQRGRVYNLEVTIEDLLMEQYYLAADRRTRRVLAALSDAEHIPTRMKLWSVSSENLSARTDTLPLFAPARFPDSFNRAHLKSLDFRFLKWHDQPGALVDSYDRLALMYFGAPAETLEWERGIIEASQQMADAHEYLRRQGFQSDELSDGIQCFGFAGRRPQNIRTHQPVSALDVVRSELRNSSPIQNIASFQNHVFQKVAPRAWTSANQIIDAVCTNDVRLHLPFSYYTPTAFSRTDYRFSVSGTPRAEEASYTPGMTALTALGDYDADEGELILWTEKTVINFPVGATILLPKWLPYSFTAVESPGSQMILSQMCEDALGDFVANGFLADDVPVRMEGRLVSAVRKREAVAGAALYGTLTEYDDDYENALLLELSRSNCRGR
ncbi:hypothetical protein C8R47DRAFT_1084852 [Mycena vitilis]|nr:hypothetical protein C8R47DRAFT_1084852 [Mycena vitilis]